MRIMNNNMEPGEQESERKRDTKDREKEDNKILQPQKLRQSKRKNSA